MFCGSVDGMQTTCRSMPIHTPVDNDSGPLMVLSDDEDDEEGCAWSEARDGAEAVYEENLGQHLTKGQEKPDRAALVQGKHNLLLG